VVVVGPCLANGFEIGFLAGGDRRERIQEVAGREREAVEPRHHHRVA
jgi:hypothetical protein